MADVRAAVESGVHGVNIYMATSPMLRYSPTQLKRKNKLKDMLLKAKKFLTATLFLVFFFLC